MKYPFRSACVGLFLLSSVLVPTLPAMPPHPDLVARIASGQQEAPYYLQHFAEVRAKGVDSPTRTRTVDELRNRTLDENFPILVILVDFSDKISHVAGTSFDNLMFGDQTGSLKNYYSQVTYGNLTLVTLNLPSATGWQRAPQTYAYYVNNQNGFGSYPQNAQRMVEDVVNAVDPMIDFSQYDSDNDGTVEGLFIVHAGRGAECGGTSADIWSHAWGTNANPHVDGVWVRQYSMEPEYWYSYGDMTCGVYAHEMGHAVFGLPDFYDTGYDSRGLGNWSLMAGGSWNGTLGNSPAHPDAWSRIHMGVVTVTNVVSNLVGASIPRIETTPTIYRLWNSGAAGSQYFLVENRQQTGYDTGIPTSGLLVYHIDDAVYGNNNQWYPGSGSSHYQNAIEPADGLWHLEHNNNNGDTGDPFPGSSNNRSFNGTTTPNSNSYASAATNVSISNISNSGATMTADFSVASCSPPDQVTGLTATTNRCSDVQLGWSDVTGATAFRVYRNGTQIGSDLAAHTLTYTDASGTGGTSYSYTVAALTGTCVGTASASATGTRLSSPAQVTGVSASSNRCADVHVSWTDLSGEIGYRVYRNGTQLGTDLVANSTSYTDTTAVAGTSYSYAVQAFNATCNGTTSSTVTGLRLITPPQVSNVAATSGRCSDVIVTWSDVTGESGYRVLRNGSQIGSDLAANTVSYTDASGSAGVTYNYSVIAMNGACTSPVSATAGGSQSGGPAQVTGVTASSNRCADVLVNWTNLANETGYRVLRNGSQIGSDLAANTTSYTDVSAVPGTSYLYSVVAFSAACTGATSATATGLRLVTPAQVMGVAATTDRCTDVLVSWTDVSGGAGYRVFRNGSQIGSDLAPNTACYSDGSASVGVTYIYTVIAFNGACTSPTSASASGSRTAGPTQVTGVNASTNRCADVLVSWSAQAAVTGYRVYRNAVQIGSDVAAGATNYTDASGTAGVSYSYSVAAISGICVGTVSASVSGSRLGAPAQVTGVTASTTHCEDITIAWTDISAATGYRVFRNGTQVGTDLAAHVTSFVDQSASAGISYPYTVQALSATCAGSVSATVNGQMLGHPAQVSGVGATTDRCSDIFVTWTDLSGETGYRVYRNGTLISGDLAANRTSYSDATAAAGVSYDYRVMAFAGSCSGTQSASVAGRRLTNPGQVTNVTASNNRCSDIRVTWTDAGNGVGYRVLRNGAQVSADLPEHSTSFADSNATSGVTFNYTVVAFNGSCTGTASTAAQGIRLSAPPAVANFAASSDRCSDIRITWTDLSTETGYRLYRNGVQLGNDLAANTNAYIDSTVTPGVSYGYSLFAFNASCVGASSVTRTGVRLVLPDPVPGVAATTDRCLNVLISWNDLPNETNYRVFRNGTAIGSLLPANTLSFSDSTGTAGVTYLYTVAAYNGSCQGLMSASTSGLRLTPLSLVTGVTATRDRCREVLVSWQEMASVTGYRVYRNTVLLSGNLPAGTTSFADTTCTSGLSYAYTVQAYRNACDGLPSAPASGYRISPPNTVAGVQATQTRCSDVLVTWNSITNVGGYRVLRNGIQISGNLSSQTLSYYDTSAAPSVVYGYTVVGYNGACESLPSASAGGMRIFTPAQVTGVLASSNRCTDILVSWNESVGASTYRVYRNGTAISADLPEHTTSFTDLAVTAGVYYSYTVSAFNGNCTAPISAAGIGSKTAALPAVTGITATVDHCNDILISWSAVSLADSIQVLRNGARIGSVGGSVRSYSDVSAEPGSYAYQVIAYNVCGAGESGSSCNGRRRDIPLSVTSVTATQNRCSDVFVNWTSVSNASGYTVLRGNDSISTVASDVSTYYDNAATPGVSYNYRVRAYNDCGSASASSPVTGLRQAIPATVTDVQASDNRCDSIVVTWTAVSGVSGYRIYQNGTQIGSAFGSVTRFAVSPPAGSYSYTVASENMCGLAAASASDPGTRWEAPGAPRSLTASSSGCGWIELSWTAALGHVDQYEIFRDGSSIGTVTGLTYADSISGTHSYQVRSHSNYCGDDPASQTVQGSASDRLPSVASLEASSIFCTHIQITWLPVSGAVSYTIHRNADSVGTASSNQLSYNDYPPVPGSYSYTVTPVNLCGNGITADPVIGTQRSAPLSVSNVMATQNECGRILVMWNDVMGETGCSIFRDGDSLSSVAANLSEFADSTAVPGVSHTYSVRSYNDCGTSPLAGSAVGLRLAEPLGVSNLAASTDRCDSVIVSWVGLQNDADYLVFRDGVEIGQTLVNETRFADVPDYGIHAYALQARNTCGISALATPVSGERPQGVTAPTTVIASDSLCGLIDITWDGATGSIQSYEILRNGISIATVPADSHHYADLSTEGTVDYSVIAHGACGDNPVSTVDAGTGYAMPTVPLDLMVASEGCNSLQFTWTPARGSIVNYIVYRDGIAVDSLEDLSFIDLDLDNPGEHSYQVAAWNPVCGAGPMSPPINASLLPLVEFSQPLPDTVSGHDTLHIELAHCDGVTGDSLFMSIDGQSYQYLSSFAPVQNVVSLVLPEMDSVYTPACRLLVISRRGTRTDSMLSAPFMIYAPHGSAVTDPDPAAPKEFVLAQNYPNPFNPSTTIRFSVPRQADVRVDILDILGRQVATLANGPHAPGDYALNWNGADCATGVYMLRLQTGDKVLLRKMMLLK